MNTCANCNNELFELDNTILSPSKRLNMGDQEIALEINTESFVCLECGQLHMQVLSPNHFVCGEDQKARSLYEQYGARRVN